jgi:hypothetical protein
MSYIGGHYNGETSRHEISNPLGGIFTDIRCPLSILGTSSKCFMISETLPLPSNFGDGLEKLWSIYLNRS